MILDRNLKIILASSEVAPFAKVGGLADVAGSLPKALTALGNDVRVVMPRYKAVTPEETIMDFPVQVGDRKETAVVKATGIEAKVNGGWKRVPVYLIDNYQYFDRDGVYGYPDDAERFIFFSKAVLEMLPRLGFQPDIIHCNDWETAPVPLMLNEFYANDPFFSKVCTVFTIHNLAYQGNFPIDVLRLMGVGEHLFHPGGVEFYGSVSFMKAGITYSDVINTVSKKYAQEIQTAEFGERMEGLLRKRGDDLYGIVNGINYHEFNPRTDPRIYKNFDSTMVGDKKENKFALQKEMNLHVRDVPLIGLVSRLVDQKGLDIVLEAMPEILGMDVQLILLGTGDPHYERMFKSLSESNPGKVAAFIGFNGILAQRIYAGADMFLMPSRFEPCGLGQLISLRYGTIPVVRHVGGLADTIFDYDAGTGMGNGFSFKEYSSDALMSALRRAISAYSDREKWRRLVQSAMDLDFSWNRSAAEYMDLYDRALMKKDIVELTA
ncbi:MAG: glycogen synthase GlgA [Firmicutes bacterium]|nr:glycogen synthase GlgA [Bacillota bacterium]